MTINVTLPLDKPTGVTATIQEGGNLEADTTYYFVVLAWDNDGYLSSTSGAHLATHSPISDEGTFTTTSTHKSALINWTNSVGHDTDTRYEILISKTSGDYTDSNSVGTKPTIERLQADITDGTTGFTVTDLQTGDTQNFVIHSCQLANPYLFNIDRDLGIIKIDLVSGTNTIDDIYDAIVTAGLSDYVYYDGNIFVLKGIITSSGTSSGTTNITKKTVVFLRGGIFLENPNYILRFGQWLDDERGANQNAGCVIDVHNTRWPIQGRSEGVLRIYGSRITASELAITSETQIVYDAAYSHPTRHPVSMIGRSWISEYRQNIIGMPFRDYSSGSVKDTTFNVTNNYGSATHYRVNIISSGVNLPYASVTRFYETTWSGTTQLQRYMASGVHLAWSCYFYNNNFPLTANNVPTGRWRTPNALGETVTAEDCLYWEIKLKIIDEDGNPIENATVSLKDKDNNDGEWIEFDTEDIDKDITGNEYTGEVQTNVNGIVNYYVLSTRFTLDPDYDVTGTLNHDFVITESFYPYTIKVSKQGFETQTIYLENFTDKVESVCVLKKAIDVMPILSGGVAIKADPTNSTKDRELLF